MTRHHALRIIMWSILLAPLFDSVGQAEVLPLPRHAEPIYFQNGVDLYVLDAPDFPTDYANYLSASGGTFVMSLRRLVFEDSEPDADIVISAPPSLTDMLIIGDDTRLYALTGKHASSAIKEQEVVTLTGVGVSTAKSLTYQIGSDTGSVLVPQDVLDEGPTSDKLVEFSVNGSSVDVSAELFYELLEGDVTPAEAPPELQDLADKFQTSWPSRSSDTMPMRSIRRVAPTSACRAREPRYFTLRRTGRSSSAAGHRVPQ